jgi:riboflavin kinase/FMN adenylyltransferase
MKIIKGNMAAMEPIEEPIVLTLGNFDGVHRGHQALLKKNQEVSQKLSACSAVLCFDPHPSDYFQTPGFQYLQTLEQKIECLQKISMDYLFIQDFSREFSEQRVKDFLRQYFGCFRHLRGLVVGYDYRFAYRGQGTFDDLKTHFEKQGVQVVRVEAFQLNGETVSSTSIRQCLRQGQVAQASIKLGRSYEVMGKVESGQQLGRELGFPTANLRINKSMLPLNGVYICQVVLNNNSYEAVANVGSRPTVHGTGKRLEVHLIDFKGDLYGQLLRVQFLEKLRDEKKFDGTQELKDQVMLDIAKTRQYFKDEG